MCHEKIECILEEHDNECHRLLRAAKALVAGDELDEFMRVPSVGNLGENKKYLGEMAKRLQ
jgi:hypothetical protein